VCVLLLDLRLMYANGGSGMSSGMDDRTVAANSSPPAYGNKAAADATSCGRTCGSGSGGGVGGGCCCGRSADDDEDTVAATTSGATAAAVDTVAVIWRRSMAVPVR